MRGNSVISADVLIVGAGPAGLAAALELKKLGVKDILVVERESETGGIPRLCGHTGFGIRDLHRVMTGPSYARKYREMAEQAGIKIATNTTITGWDSALTPALYPKGPTPRGERGNASLKYTSPDGVGTIEAKSVLLATGVRERPRSARLIPGYRPQGAFTTGSLQRFVYEYGLPVGKRAVIVGAEIVSLSVVPTLLHARVKVVGMVTELPSHQLYLPIFLPAKIFYADILARTAILPNKRITNILGRSRVEGVEVTDLESGKTEVIECDTVVFTGDWIPENELARRGEVETLQPSLGPQVDAMFRTSQVARSSSISFSEATYTSGDSWTFVAKPRSVFTGNLWPFITGAGTIEEIPTTAATSVVGDAVVTSGITPTTSSTFEVESTDPEDETSHVTIPDGEYTIEVVFSDSINPATVVSGVDVTVTTEAVNGDTSISAYGSCIARPSVSGDTLSIVVASGYLLNNNLVTVTLDSTIASAGGVSLGEDYTFWFTTTYSPYYCTLRKIIVKS